MKDCIALGRMLCPAALLALLAFSSYMSMPQKEQTAMVSVPVVFEAIEDVSAILPAEEAESRLKQERERALSLLEDVIRDPKASEAAIESALMQKTEMADQMETEARIVETLDAMGFPGTAALCGGTMTTVIVPQNLLFAEKARIQIIDAAANAAKRSADCIKIIPQKNE